MALVRVREISYDEYQRRSDYWLLQAFRKKMDLRMMSQQEVMMQFFGRPKAATRKPRRGKLLFTIGARPTTS